MEFYDTVGDKDVKLTDADVNYEWLTPTHDWAGPDPEVLSVSYLRPKTGVGSPNRPFLRRQQAFDRGKKVKPGVPCQTVESENISDIGSEFITMINCRPFRPNRRGFCSFFLQPRRVRHNEETLKRAPHAEPSKISGRNAQVSSPNDEAGMSNDETGMTKSWTKMETLFRASSFGILSSFVIRISSFKTVIGRILLVACILVFAAKSEAQIQVDLKFKRLQYIAYEPVVATISVTNLAGRDIDLHDAEGQSWLGFEITGSEGQPVTPMSAESGEAPLKVAAGQRVTHQVNLTPLYPVHDFGTYHVRTNVYFADLGKFFYSPTRVFEVTDARPIWQQTVGIPMALRHLATRARTRFSPTDSRIILLCTSACRTRTVELCMRLIR